MDERRYRSNFAQIARVSLREHEVLFGRVAALQCAVLFASLKRTNLMFVISIRSEDYFDVCNFDSFKRANFQNYSFSVAFRVFYGSTLSLRLAKEI